MQVQVNSDASIQMDERLIAYVQQAVDAAVRHHADQITRAEVHLSDENSAKGGADDKRCLIEVRLENRTPVAVSHRATTLDLAITGAADKLAQHLRHTIGRLRARQGR